MKAGIHLMTPFHLSKASQYVFTRLTKCGAHPRIGFEGMPDLTHMSRVMSNTNTFIISPNFINERVINTLRKDWHEKKINNVEVFCKNSNIPSLLGHLKGTGWTDARKIASIFRKKNAFLLIEPMTHKHSRSRTPAVNPIIEVINDLLDDKSRPLLSDAEEKVVSSTIHKYLSDLIKDPASRSSFNSPIAWKSRLMENNPQMDNDRAMDITAAMVLVCDEALSRRKDITPPADPHRGSREGLCSMLGGEKVGPNAAALRWMEETADRLNSGRIGLSVKNERSRLGISIHGFPLFNDPGLEENGDSGDRKPDTRLIFVGPNAEAQGLMSQQKAENRWANTDRDINAMRDQLIRKGAIHRLKLARFMTTFGGNKYDNTHEEELIKIRKENLDVISDLRNMIVFSKTAGMVEHYFGYPDPSEFLDELVKTKMDLIRDAIEQDLKKGSPKIGAELIKLDGDITSLKEQLEKKVFLHGQRLVRFNNTYGRKIFLPHYETDLILARQEGLDLIDGILNMVVLSKITGAVRSYAKYLNRDKELIKLEILDMDLIKLEMELIAGAGEQDKTKADNPGFIVLTEGVTLTRSPRRRKTQSQKTESSTSPVEPASSVQAPPQAQGQLSLSDIKENGWYIDTETGIVSNGAAVLDILRQGIKDIRVFQKVARNTNTNPDNPLSIEFLTKEEAEYYGIPPADLQWEQPMREQLHDEPVPQILPNCLYQEKGKSGVFLSGAEILATPNVDFSRYEEVFPVIGDENILHFGTHVTKKDIKKLRIPPDAVQWEVALKVETPPPLETTPPLAQEEVITEKPDEETRGPQTEPKPSVPVGTPPPPVKTPPPPPKVAERPEPVKAIEKKQPPAASAQDAGRQAERPKHKRTPAPPVRVIRPNGYYRDKKTGKVYLGTDVMKLLEEHKVIINQLERVGVAEVKGSKIHVNYEEAGKYKNVQWLAEESR